MLIAVAAWLLALIGGGALYVSFSAQQKYVFAARHQDAASIIEALLLDLLMIVFTLLALGLSRAGKSSRTERALILACAVASAYMNVSAADTASPRSVVAYAVAPIALAVVVDRVVAVIRRHVLGDEEASAWTAMGRALLAVEALPGSPRCTRCASSWPRRRPLRACAAGADVTPLPRRSRRRRSRRRSTRRRAHRRRRGSWRYTGFPTTGTEGRQRGGRALAPREPDGRHGPGVPVRLPSSSARAGVMTPSRRPRPCLVLLGLSVRLTVFSGNRIRRMRWRIRLRLHPGPGFATTAELLFRWSRLAALHHGRRARPGMRLRHRATSRTTQYAVRLGRAHYGRRAFARAEDQTIILSLPGRQDRPAGRPGDRAPGPGARRRVAVGHVLADRRAPQPPRPA